MVEWLPAACFWIPSTLICQIYWIWGAQQAHSLIFERSDLD